MVEFKAPHYDKELEAYINSHPMFCEENTRGCICKSDFFQFIYEREDSILKYEFKDIDWAFWIAGSLKYNDSRNLAVEITWERVNEFFERIEPMWEAFYGKPSGFELRNPNNPVVMLTDDDEDFVV